MTSVSQKAKSQGIFYGWFVVAACFVAAASLAEAWLAFGLFVKPLEKELGWSRSAISSGASLIVFGYAIGAILTGRLADRYSPRLVLLPSAVIAGLGIALSGRVNSVDQLRLFCFLAGLGAGPTAAVPAATVQRWFRGRRNAGTALAVSVSGSGVGQLIFAPLVNYFILSYGWRNAFLMSGIMFFAITFIASLFIRRSPAEAAASPSQENVPPTSYGGWSTGKALTTSAFIAIIFSGIAGQIGSLAITVHLVPYAIDLKMSPTVAAAALGLMGGLSTPGRLVSGFLADKIGWRKALVLSFLGSTAALIWLLLLRQPWMLYGFVFLLGTFNGIRLVSQFGLVGEFFGLRSAGALLGITTGAPNLISAAAPYVAGVIFDATNSYSVAFVIMTVLMLSGGLTIMLVKKPVLAPAQTPGHESPEKDR